MNLFAEQAQKAMMSGAACYLLRTRPTAAPWVPKRLGRKRRKAFKARWVAWQQRRCGLYAASATLRAVSAILVGEE